MKLFIISDERWLRESLLIYYKALTLGSQDEVRELKYDEFLDELSSGAIGKEKENNERLLIDYSIFAEDGKSIIDFREGFLHDPSNYKICDILASIIFNVKYYDGNKNWLLKRIMFFGFFNLSKYLNNKYAGKHLLNYCILPQELEKLNKFISHKTKASDLNSEGVDVLWEDMEQNLKEAFGPHPPLKTVRT